MLAEPEQVRVLVVSGSPYTRYVVSGELSAQPDLFVVGTARNPDEIDSRRRMLRPHVAIVDLASPNDLIDLQPTLARHELPVLALCPRDREGADLAFAALEAGAVDVVVRSRDGFESLGFGPDLVRKVRGTSRSKPRLDVWQWSAGVPRAKTCPRRFLPGDALIVICASTGGLGPMTQLLTALPGELRASVLALTPLPESYLRWFVRRLSPATGLCLYPARDNLPLERGAVYLAPQDCQMVIGFRGLLALDWVSRSPKEQAPVDASLSSLATGYGPAVICVVLSGIGRDGVKGALDVCAAGGAVIVQDISSCVAKETPQAVIEAVMCSGVLPPEGIVEEIVRRAGLVETIPG